MRDRKNRTRGSEGSARKAGPPRHEKRAAGAPSIPEWLIPALAVLVALGLRLWAWRHQPWVTVDGTEYIRLATALASGQSQVSMFPPGYPALIAIARLVVFDRVAAAVVVSLIAGALLPWPTWALARGAVGPRWAALPAFAVALHPVLARFSVLSMSESAYILALYGALAWAAVPRALPAGIAMGAAFAIRPEALVPALALAIRSGLDTLRRVSPPRLLGLGALGFLVLAVPCWIYFHSSAGVWTLTPKLAAFRAPAQSWVTEEAGLKTTPASPETHVAEPLGRKAAEALRHYPSNALGHARSLIDLWPAPLLLLSLWGLVRRRGIEALPLLHLVAIPLLGLSAQPRFVLSAVPSLAILATVPLALARDRRLRTALAALWLGGAVWCGVLNGPRLALPFEGYAQAQKEAGEWLSGVAERGAPVMDRKPHLAFYAGLPYRVMPEAPYDSLLDYAVLSGVRYLVLDEGVIRIFRPQLQPLLYDPAARDREPRLEMIYAGGHFKGFGVAIFRVLQPGEPKTGKPPRFAVRWVTPGGTPPKQ